MTIAAPRSGAGFLLGSLDIDTMHSPERLTEEQRMLRETARRFTESEIVPRLADLEELNHRLAREILVKAGELGLFYIDIPEKYGGLGLDFISSLQAIERLGWGGGIATAFQVQTVIGLLPILYFGNEAQKSHYLPRIGSGELISAYALTEPGSGSDALAAKTTATASADGESWVLNGTKQFITNGGFADIFIVFAQVDGKDFSAFIVERDAPGFGIGAEEHKLGIKSSSTTSLSFTDCRIPKENLIGEVGWGGRIALNVLNVGRLKLGVQSLGAAKEALEEAVRYALERRQFGKAIAEFGIIREKIAEMAARIFASESTSSRTAGSVVEAIAAAQSEGGDGAETMIGALREYCVECALEKVHGTEAQDYCADEAVQIHGGYGFIEEYKVARLYRDARISRLYEGTNEINRMQIAGEVLKRAAKGSLPLDEALLGGEDLEPFAPMADLAAQIAQGKRIVARLVQLIGQGHGGKVEKRGGNQELLQRLADIIIGLYGVESTMGRTLQAHRAGNDHADAFEAMSRVYAWNAAATTRHSTREILGLMARGGGLGAEQAELEELCTTPLADVIGLRRAVAQAVIEREGAWFE